MKQIDQINAMIDAKRAEMAAAEAVLHGLRMELEDLEKLRHGVRHQPKIAGQRQARVKTRTRAR